MEVDIDIILKNIKKEEAAVFEAKFIVGHNKDKSSGIEYISIRQNLDNEEGVIDHIIFDFLIKLKLYSEIIKKHEGVIRIGVFYSLDESVVFPLRLSHKSIRLIADLNLAIDATGYPSIPDD